MTDVLLAADGVGMAFGGLRALDGFTLRLRAGDLVGLIGPNGAGKTTAFNVLTGVYAATSGDVRVQGERIAGKRPHEINRLGLARTFQNIRLFKQLSVLDNVRIACRPPSKPLFSRMGKPWNAWNNYYDWWRALLLTPGTLREERAVEAEARELLDIMGLAERALQPAGSLPYGEQRRLEIARALGTRPRVLLLDEPAAGMNAREKTELMTLIRSLRDRFSLGVLVIEHDMKLVMGICESITVLDHGETIATGTPSEVRAHPEVIAAYLGDAFIDSHARPPSDTDVEA